MKIKDVADRVGLSVEAIRYYEREGLSLEPDRATNGYRQYSQAQVQRLGFIASCRALEMSHDEIRALITLCDSPRASCQAVSQVLEQHIDHVKERVKTLQQLLKQLQTLRSKCNTSGTMDSCEIIEALGQVIAKPKPGHHSHV